MALIKCPECGKTISDQAVNCTDCGYPIQKWLKQQQREAEQAARAERAELRRMEKEAAALDQLTDKQLSGGTGKKIGLKLLLVIILGGMLFIFQVLNYITGAYRIVVWLLLLTVLLSAVNLLPMLFCVMKKRIPAVILCALFLTLYVVVIVTAIFQQSFYASFSSAVVSLLLCTLMLLYALIGFRNRNSIVWALIFIGIETIDFFLVPLIEGDQLSYVFLRYAYNPINLIVYLFSLAYYFIGYSPDKWYSRKRTNAKDISSIPEEGEY